MLKIWKIYFPAPKNGSRAPTVPVADWRRKKLATDAGPAVSISPAIMSGEDLSYKAK